ncbi:MAG TPA: family 1 glycosylhydrolase, partial [Longimicrobiaceae bacterium]|nr:family 1 glycosylhydrolase [Longimicrobiaceae bacterium]
MEPTMQETAAGSTPAPHGVPELWGGLECTVNRVGDRYLDQMERNGHAVRVNDLERFAGLGIRALRYPVLWERVAPEGVDRADWQWPDERLARLRALGIRPILTLVHHGSGPRHTSLVDPGFAAGLAEFARAVAERYPWVDAYTPVNEPLTTARFSGLYGHWYPHGKDYPTFARALMTECQATAAAMRAIREVSPGAQLVQTEDAGRTFSTPLLAYQAEFENHRRWLSLDLLCGRVDRGHPLWDDLAEWGIGERELDELAAAPCPPDVIGLNYYLTSDRVLDERVEHYPEWSHGGNPRHDYADVEAVRAWGPGILGHRAVLAEAWERYRLPVALTEVHLGSTRDEQLRWVAEAWDAARGLRDEGVDVRAVTIWSLLGAYDWNRLCTRERGFYEPGVFDLRGGAPRPTALAAMMQGLARDGRHDHPVLQGPGWWRRPTRLIWGPSSGSRPALREEGGDAARPLLVTGASGTLGREFSRACEARGLRAVSLTRREMDIADPVSVENALRRFRPWAVVNAAGYVRVDDAEHEPDACMRENADGPTVLAAACARHGAALVTFSSDLVFDGAGDAPYLENDPVAPLSVYGRSKAAAESRVLDAFPGALVVRTSAFFGPWDEHNFVAVALRTLAAVHTFAAAEDATVSPTYVPDLAHACLDLLVDGERGIWHLASPGAVTWAELARRGAELAGLDPARVEGRPTAALGLAAPRPLRSVLGSGRGALLPPLDDALARYFEE